MGLGEEHFFLGKQESQQIIIFHENQMYVVYMTRLLLPMNSSSSDIR